MIARSNRTKKSKEVAIADAARRSKAAYDRFLALPDSEKTRVAENLGKLDLSRHSRPLNAAERELWNRVKKRLGRPRRGEGAKPVNVTIERGLLARADEYAHRNGLTRSQVIARGIELAISG
jgi:hypothetical protein